MIHPHTEVRFVNKEIGNGVFATRFIPRGTVTWVRDDLDRVFSSVRLPAAYNALLDKYTYGDDFGNRVLCWDHARTMNHSCRPTCHGAACGFEVAVRDIRPGEELTDDYAALQLLPHESFTCLCGEPNCRGRIGHEDVESQEENWAEVMRGALPLIHTVHQPLAELFDEADLARAFREFGLPEFLSWAGTSSGLSLASAAAAGPVARRKAL